MSITNNTANDILTHDSIPVITNGSSGPHPDGARGVSWRGRASEARGARHSAKGGAVETGCSDLYYVIY